LRVPWRSDCLEMVMHVIIRFLIGGVLNMAAPYLHALIARFVKIAAYTTFLELETIELWTRVLGQRMYAVQRQGSIKPTKARSDFRASPARTYTALGPCQDASARIWCRAEIVHR